jgi:hypothetical protein
VDDLKREQAKAEVGIFKASAVVPSDWLEWCRNVAVAIASESGRVTIDDVRSRARVERPDIIFGSWAGAIFRGSLWRCVGYTHATHEGSHARLLRVWTVV